KRIGFLVFDGVVATDLFGPADAFSFARFDRESDSQRPRYELLMVAPSKNPITTTSGFRILPDRSFKDTPELDTLIVPGGLSLQKASVGKPVSAFIKARASSTRRIVSICTGLYALADTGLLGGRRVTTHWRFAKEIARHFPDLRVYDNSIYL